MPLHRRLPKKGFHNPFKRRYDVINIWQLNRFQKEREIAPDDIKKAGLISGNYPVKLLGSGELKNPLKVRVHSASETARKKVEKAGGTVEVIS